MTTTPVHPLASPKVYVVLVCWNGWEHTLECLESLFRTDYKNFEVVVVDNASGDESANRVENWARGDLAASVATNPAMALYSMPVAKPIPFLRLSLAQSRSITRTDSSPIEHRLTLIDAGSNLGFGGGNNAGMDYISRQATGDADYIWLLNNDTVIEPSSMSRMVATAEATPAGIVGSVVRYYAQPEKVQAFGGGYFSSLTGSARLSSGSKRRSINFIFGASFMISKSTFERLGGFDERIFMYYEEVEYCIRARKQNIPMAVSDAQVYHKSGISTDNSFLKWKYIYKSRVYTMLKHFGVGAWIIFTKLNWLTNVLSPFADKGKRRASREAFALLAQSVVETLRK